MVVVMTTVIDDVVGRESRHVLQTYRRQPVTFVRGQGVRLFDAEGREYLDLLSGIGVAALGHAHRGLARAISEQADTLMHTSNLFFHPLQGEGGLRPLTPAFAAAINETCAKTGALFIADEVQSGLGRTGYPFYFKALGLKPHLVSVGKALGGGVPIGAALVSQDVADTISFGDHGSTYGGNLLACRAALCVLDELVGGGLLAHIGRVGPHFEQQLKAMAARHSIVKDVRGGGLMWGLELSCDAAPVVPAALERLVVVNRTAETVVRLLPPLVIP